MIRTIHVTNSSGEKLSLELSSPEESGLAVLSVDGLGPSESNINLTEMLTIPGGLFNSSRILSRNILFSLRFLEKPSIEATRLMSYRFFPITEKITIEVVTDTRTGVIDGYVERNDVKMFSDKSGTVISVICPDPFFKGNQVQETTFAGTEKIFEFPFSNESLTVKLLEMGTVFNNETALLNYQGETKTGILIRLHFLDEVINLSLYNSRTRELMRIDSAKLSVILGSPIQAGDDILINTIRGQKSITLTRSGISYNIINALGISTDWIGILPGDNIIGYTADVGGSKVQMIIENYLLFDGM